jgi:hypothetical protein
MVNPLAGDAGLIDVKLTENGDPLRFAVTVAEGASTSRHQVSARALDVARLAGAATPEQLIKASFRFLLDREPKESILSRFDLTVISRYFPDFEATLPQYLSRTA